jgi:hypothetical protein
MPKTPFKKIPKYNKQHAIVKKTRSSCWKLLLCGLYVLLVAMILTWIVKVHKFLPSSFLSSTEWEWERLAFSTEDPSKRSRRNETTSQGMMTMSMLWRRSQQRSFMAQSALTYMKTNNHLTTEFSNRKQVLQKGFPRQWNPCVLERIFQQRDEAAAAASIPKLTIALVGGSTAARPGNHCQKNSQGRYSDMLQNKLDQVMLRYSNKNNNNTADDNDSNISSLPTMKMIVENLAQGATITVDNAIVMDQFFVPGQTDVIVWDFWVNGKFSILVLLE